MNDEIVFADSLDETFENLMYFDEVSQTLKQYLNGMWKTIAYKHVIHNGYELIKYKEIK